MGCTSQHGFGNNMSHVPRTDGSKSTKMERGTYLPLPVSVKKVSNEPPSERAVASGLGRPSALRPCSSRYLGSSCQREFEVCDWVWGRTAPTRCSRAACRPGQCEGGRSVKLTVSVVVGRNTSCPASKINSSCLFKPLLRPGRDS
jgi:hypothetical protein